MKALVVLLGLLAATPAYAKGRAYHCFYVVSHRTGEAESACFASKPKCETKLRSYSKLFRHPRGLDTCFVSRETQSFEVPVHTCRPQVVMFPNRATCLDFYNVHLQSGDAPTFCHPTESK